MAVTLIEEYKELLKKREQIKTEMKHLPQGYISKKNINGNEYYYLQNRKKGKITSKYLKKEEIAEISEQIKLHKQHKTLQPQINIRLKELEQAAQLIDKKISRRLILLKISINIDELNTKQKEESISFASAMNTIQKIPISKQTKTDIADWKNGNKTFITIFQNTLNHYGFTTED